MAEKRIFLIFVASFPIFKTEKNYLAGGAKICFFGSMAQKFPTLLNNPLKYLVNADQAVESIMSNNTFCQQF